MARAIPESFRGLGRMASIVPLATALGDLKRIRDATSSDSLAERAFRTAWARLAGGETVADVALCVTADALAATRLGGIDRAMLNALGVSDPVAVLRRGFDEASGAIQPALRQALQDHLGWTVAHPPAPAFVETLIRQPRAGATAPGKPRIVLAPPESHGDHCLVVAVLGVVLAGANSANPATAFIAGLAHHLHNAVLPDSGFAGEVLLGDELAPIMERLFHKELATLAEPVAETVRFALATIGNVDTTEGRAFNAADVIDRVLQVRHYEQVAAFTASQALDDLDLVHAGPLQAFHRAVLAETGLAEARLP